MAYDVFISYSRKDMAIADRICSAFDKAGISYFIDRVGISGGFEFPEILAKNIVNSKLFLLLASKNAYESKFTTSEIVFAFNKKAKNSVIPYIIDDSNLPLSLEFIFAGVNWRNITEHPIETTLVADILKLLEKEATQSSFAYQQQPLPTKKYRVGDYYDDGIKQGVVFEVSADGKHGKIVSLQESKSSSWVFHRTAQQRIIGAHDKHDGAINMIKIKQISDWQELYTPFAWCASLGEDWYLPAIEELKLFCFDTYVHDAVNRTLANTGQPLPNKGDERYYWSSTEEESLDSEGEARAWQNNFYLMKCYHSRKYERNRARAVAKF